LEDVERSESEHVSLRVFAGGGSASIGSSDLADAALDELARRAVAMARLAPPDPYAGLADEALLLNGAAPDCDLDDGAATDPQALRTLAHA
ncbi:PmbA/TldA family metallopeptidase, partial [Enterococcus faecalis]|uniref:PmbA/TldA family metallopeptidase n=1 Tax=Enterococcus faecalis TaxID=1351 RepID=UPI00403F492D